MIGKPVKRKEDPRLIQGKATYIDDMKRPRMGFAQFVRSPHAHARITSIDTEPALGLDGVRTVITGADLAGQVQPVPRSSRLLQNLPEEHPLAVETVHYAGQPVACVVADDPYTARDGAEAIRVRYERLEAVAAAEEALEADAPLAHQDFDNNLAFRYTKDSGGTGEAFERADHIVELRLTNQRIAAVAIEPRGVVSEYDRGKQQLTLHSSTQSPQKLRHDAAQMLGIPENRLRVTAPEVGGGFGSKIPSYVEEAVIGYLAMKLNRPVKWIETRSENFLATAHGRNQIHEAKAAVDANGTILAVQDHILTDLGAYPRSMLGPVTAKMIPGVYRIPEIKVDVTAVYTNTTPIGAYRGAGRPEAIYLIERLVDRVAQVLDTDPVELRRKNFIPKNAFPYTTVTGHRYDSGDYERALDKALAAAGYRQLRQKQEKLRKQNRYLGIGVSTYVEVTGLSTYHLYERATVQAHSDGRVTVLSGTSPHGQGHETSWAQLVADRFGLPLEDIELKFSDTEIIPYGSGTMGSRSAPVGGSAISLALNDLEAKIRRLAAHMLEIAEDDVVIENGNIHPIGVKNRSLPFKAVAQRAHAGYDLPNGMDPGLVADRFYQAPDFTFPFGCHICLVEVETETGDIHLKSYTAVDDCGRVINPLIVDGQVHGGITQGLAQAVSEEIVYDENGQLINGSLIDYSMPTAVDVPWYNTGRTETPSPVNPLGVKGVGEAGTIGSTPAVVNAVIDALQPLGVTHIDMPLKPLTVWQAIQKAKDTH